MQRRAAIWILGAFQTSPSYGIEAITDLMPIHLHFHKLRSRVQLRAHLLPDNHILKSLLEARPNLNIDPHCLSLDSLTSFQRVKIKGTIIDINDRFNEILLAFDPLNIEFTSGSRVIDMFANHVSFHPFIKSSKDSFKSCSLLLSNLTITSLSDSLHALMVIDASIKHYITMSIAHIHICNKDIIKIIHHTVNVLSTEAKLIAIRCGINQATNIFGISKFIVITNSLHVSRRIFDLSLHPYQKHTAAISHELRRLFFNNINNSIEFWECPS